MDHELITVDEKEIVEKWNVGKLSGKLKIHLIHRLWVLKTV